MMMAMVFALLGTGFVNAKVYKDSKADCKKNGHEWRNGKCRDKMKNKNAVNGKQPIMGGSSTTYAPQVFTPEAPYNAPGLVGNYFSGTNIATIYDPSGQTDESYTFTDIQAISQSIRASGVLIGTMPTPGFVQSAASCSGCKSATTRLYGTLVPEDAAA